MKRIKQLTDKQIAKVYRMSSKEAKKNDWADYVRIIPWNELTERRKNVYRTFAKLTCEAYANVRR